MTTSRSSSPHMGHKEVWSLLPWYVNGTLNGPELDRVRQHIDVCVTCRKELEIQHRLAEAVRNSNLVSLSSKVAFLRLRERITNEVQPPVHKTRWRHYFLSKCSHVSTSLFSSPVLRRTAVALSAVLMIAITLFTAQRLSKVNEEPLYRTLATSPALPTAQNNEIYVVFSDSVERARINQLLRAARAEIVDGPSSLGVYTLRIVAGGTSGRDVLPVIEQLRRDPSVQLAEPVTSSSANYPTE